MEVMFSNTDEELAKQVDNDIKEAQSKGVVDTEEIEYKNLGDGKVAITDKENGEVTLAQKADDEADTYDLVAVPDGQLEKFVHPSEDGVTEGNQVGAPDEKVDDHFGEGSVIAPNQPDGGLNHEAGHEKSVEETAKEGPQPEGKEVCPECGEKECKCEEKKEEEKDFSISSTNAAWQKIFSMPQEFCDYLFSEVIESEETSKVGDLKVEKCDDNAVLVTSESTGDQCKVELNGDDMEVTELDSKNFSEEEQFMPLFVVGVQPYDHIIVDAQEYSQESAEQLKAQLTEDGIEGVQIFDNQKDAREYAISLLEGLGASPAAGQVEEPELQKEYSEAVGTEVYATRFYSDSTEIMCRMFSESVNGISELQDAVNDVIRNDEAAEIDGIAINPVDAQNAVIVDGGEYTLATLDGEDMRLQAIDAEEAQDILGDESIIESESEENEQASEEPNEKEFSGWYQNEKGTRFFSETEKFNSYMERLYSGESDQDQIEVAIQGGEPVETETEVITPINGDTAVVQDKANGEFSKVKLEDEDIMNIHPISEEEAKNMLGEGSEPAPTKESENTEAAEEGEQKNYSEYDWTNEAETRYFSEGEEFTAYMERLFSEEADQNEIEEAIEKGETIENDTEVITPVDDKTAVIQDKDNGEFTKAEILSDDDIEVKKISEEEADKLTSEKKEEEEKPAEPAEAEAPKEEEKKEEEKEFSDPLAKFFAAAGIGAQPVAVAPAAAPVVATQAPAVDQAALAVGAAQPVAAEEIQQPVQTVENIEDKALAAVESIKAAAEEASAQILEAKAAPAATAEPDIQEAQFSATEKTFSEGQDTLISWLSFGK